jgi:hypothetical protein
MPRSLLRGGSFIQKEGFHVLFTIWHWLLFLSTAELEMSCKSGNIVTILAEIKTVKPALLNRGSDMPVSLLRLTLKG